MSTPFQRLAAAIHDHIEATPAGSLVPSALPLDGQFFVIHYWLDNRNRTPGRCKTDHQLQAGDVIYTAQGRATVRSCRLEQSTPDHMRLPAWARPQGEQQ